MSFYARTIARLDDALDLLEISAGDLVGTDKDALHDALVVIRPVRDRLVGADHDDERRQAEKTTRARRKIEEPAR